MRSSGSPPPPDAPQGLRGWWRGRSRFARNIGQVAGANALAQALPLLAAPLLTRLYSPADFAVLALAMSVLSLALAVGTGRFEWSVPQARSRGLAAALLVWGGALLLATALLMAGLAAALPTLLAAGWWPAAAGGGGGWSWAALSGWAWLLPLALLGGGAQQLLQAWQVRGAELAAVARARLVQGLANTGVALAWPLGLGLIGWSAGAGAGGTPLAITGAAGLLLGLLAGHGAGLWPLWRQARGLPAALRRLRPGPLARRRLALAWRRCAAEAGWSTLASAVNTLSLAIVPLLLARHHGAAEVGWYALMQRVALGPVGLVGSAVSQSFWAEAAQLVRRDPAALAALYRRSTVRLVWVALPLGALALAGPWLVGPIFGRAQWAGAGAVLAASAPLIAATVIASPLSHLVIHRKQHWQAAWDVGRVALLVAVIEGLGRSGAGLVATVGGISAVMAAMYALLVLLNALALRQAVAATRRAA